MRRLALVALALASLACQAAPPSIVAPVVPVVPVATPPPQASPVPRGSPSAPYKPPLPEPLGLPIDLRHALPGHPLNGVVERAARAWNAALGEEVFSIGSGDPRRMPVYSVIASRERLAPLHDEVQAQVRAAWDGWFAAAGDSYRVENDFHPDDPGAGILGAAIRSTRFPLYDNAWLVAPFGVRDDGTALAVADVYNVALHELGHILGLTHVTTREELMFPAIDLGVGERAITPGDVARARAAVATDRARQAENVGLVAKVNALLAERNRGNGWN